MKKISLITIAIFLSFICFPISNTDFSIPSYLYFRNIQFTVLFLFSLLISHFFSVKSLQWVSYIIFLLFTLNLQFQKAFQTEFHFRLILYFFTQISYLIDDTLVFIKQLNIIFFFYVLFVFVVSWFEDLIKSKKTYFILFIFGLIVFQIFFTISNTTTTPTLSTSSESIDKKFWNKSISPISDANIVVFCLEGVSRLSLQNKKSKYFPQNQSSGHHFFIPMPHSSKSLESFLIGEINLESSRPDITKSFESSFLSILKQRGYQSYFIYSQSLYFEDLFLFVPKFFDFVYGKEDLKKLGAKEIPGFSWGLDDDSLRIVLEKVNFPKTNPMFLWIGFSQTHSPYFPKSNRFESSIQNYNLAIQENLETVDRIIDSWNPPNQIPTIFILTSDHGESFGEEGAKNHNYSLFNQEIDVPFQVYIHPDQTFYEPTLGSSIDFGESLLWLVTNQNKNPILVDSKSKINSASEAIFNSNFFQSQYKLHLIGKTWNSNIQRFLIEGDQKYVYFAEKDLLLVMDLNDENRKEVKDQLRKKKSIQKMFGN